MSGLRVGVVGVNGIGRVHIGALAVAGKSSLGAVCDVDAERVRRAAAEQGVQGFVDAAEMYASGLVDAVVIATPAGTHPLLAAAALEAGLHVYCEKPVAPRSADGDALHALAVERERVFQVGFQYRFHTGYRAMRNAFASLGPLERAHLTATNWFRPQRYFDAAPWRTTWDMAGGGVLMNQAVHQLDALVAATGMPARVRAWVTCARHRAAVEDAAFAFLEWPDGARGVVEASLSEPAGCERFELHCARGSVVVTDGYDVRVCRHDDRDDTIATCPEEFPDATVTWHSVPVARASSEWFDMFVAAHREFASAIADKRPPAVDGASGTRSVELANAIYLSSFAGETVELPLDTDRYATLFAELASGARSCGVAQPR